MRRTSSASSALSILLVALTLTGCGVLGGNDRPAPGPPTTSRPAWTPPRAEPAVVLTSPGDGGTRTIHVGDRLRIPRGHDFGGLRLKAWRGVLVPYGDDRTYLAVGAGRVPVEDTVYDHEQPCVPPQPVARFDLAVTPGRVPAIPPPRRLSVKDDRARVTLVPGQELTYPDGWELHSTTESGSVVRDTQISGTYAVRPGSVRLTLSPQRTPRTGPDRTVHVDVRVADPARSGSPNTPTTPATPHLTGAPGDTAAAPAPLPACA